MDEFFNVGNVVNHKQFGIGVVTKVYLFYCEVKFDSLKTERTIQKDFLENLSKWLKPGN